MLIKFLDGTEREIANLTGANLSGADLSGAELYGANLSGAELYGADLFEAKNILRLGPTSDGHELFGIQGPNGLMLKAGCKWMDVEGAKTLCTTPERKLFYNTVVAWDKLAGE